MRKILALAILGIFSFGCRKQYEVKETNGEIIKVDGCYFEVRFKDPITECFHDEWFITDKPDTIKMWHTVKLR